MKYLLIITTAAILFFTSCSNKDDNASASQAVDYQEAEAPALAVETLITSRESLVPYLELSGVAHGINEVNIQSQTQGEIIQVAVKLGDYVNQGDLIVQVDDTLAKLNFLAAQEQLETARIDYDALNRSIDQGGSSRRELSAAQNRMAAAQAALELARQNYENCSIRSPIDGYIANLDRSLSLGNSLSPGIPVTTIIDSQAWLMEAYVGEGLLGLIKEDATVEIRIPSLSDEAIPAEIYGLAAGGDLRTGSYKVQISWESDNPALKSGMTAQARIYTNGDSPYVLIPASAVVQREGGNYVFIEEDGLAKARQIFLGESLGNRQEVIEGLEEGEKLIISGLNSLAPDRAVVGTEISREEALE